MSAQPVLRHSEMAVLPPDPGSTPSREMATPCRTWNLGHWDRLAALDRVLKRSSLSLPCPGHCPLLTIRRLQQDPEPTSVWPGFHHQLIRCPQHQAATQNCSQPALPPTHPSAIHKRKSCGRFPAWLAQSIGGIARPLHLALRIKLMPKRPKQRKSRSYDMWLVILYS